MERKSTNAGGADLASATVSSEAGFGGALGRFRKMKQQKLALLTRQRCILHTVSLSKATDASNGVASASGWWALKQNN